ncbi:8-oxo-dGTP diphosphatase [Kiritimatiella glycovorans]|uniref:Oxidized purine nucleoside triphosphate hydrolase n=1 Tax=Kiritimatiella glycovorans TaxID=1307763 RepID=A0A0G3EL71_9BACT|nr:8-oxo-dGTP diphosphatase [Kiritimatiella glycovorans]AKJ64879.1 8-oxo-dGTP diphosphatase [Kiritimatiella glycovorans]
MMTLQDIDWEHWTPVEDATLLFVIRGGRILLIHKKRGFGAGKINGPGGRIEPGETPEECALREVEEELRIRPLNVDYAGLLQFQFVDGFSIRGHVYRAADFEGTPVETDEAIPLWCETDALPFERMWADDPVWFPHLLAGRRFSGRFIFEGERMVEYRVVEEEEEFECET